MIEKNQFSKGQTLIEALVALAVAVMVVTAISSVVTSSLSNVQFSKDQNLATHYAEEGMEYMRQIRNQQWSEYAVKFLTPTPGNGTSQNTWVIKCLNKDGTLSERDASGKCTPNVDKFIRTIKVEENSCACGSIKSDSKKNIRKVTVAVAWSDNKCMLPTPTSIPTPTPLPNGNDCTVDTQCKSGYCDPTTKKCSSPPKNGAGNIGVNQGSIEDPDCNETTVDIATSLFCHQTQLTSCFSDVANVSEP